MNFDTLLYLSRQNMKDLEITAHDMVESIQTLCVGREEGWVHVAPKNSLKPDEDRFFMSTLAVADTPGFMTIKSLGLNNRNANLGLNSIGSLITLFDAATGLPVAIMDGDWITAYRTAALSALAARFMAPKNCKVAAFIGCGIQAKSHLDIFSDLYPLEEIYILGRSSANMNSLKSAAESSNLRAVIVEDGSTAIAGADLIFTTVPDSRELRPFLNAENLKPGTFTSMVDLGRSWIPCSLNNFTRIVIDDMAQEATVAQPMINPKWMSGDLQDLIAKRISGRLNEHERTAFVFRGMAVGDLALAMLAYKKALSAGLGCKLTR